MGVIDMAQNKKQKSKTKNGSRISEIDLQEQNKSLPSE